MELDNEPNIAKPVWFGISILIIFVGGFLLWSSLAPLESASVAQGKVIVSSHKKTIQHLEGGIVKKIYIKEGSLVKAGDLLLELEDTQAKARLDLLKGQLAELYATESRLKAERDELPSIEFSPWLLKHEKDPAIKKIMNSQRHLFSANKKNMVNRIIILNQRVVQLEKEIESLQAQVDSETKQFALIGEESEAVEYLEKKKLVERPRLLALRREAARLTGNRGEHIGLIARAQQRIGEAKTQIIALQSERQQQILQELRDTQSRLSETSEREKSARDILKRTKILSPQNGRVVALNEHTIGGVIQAGEDILEIVPTQDELMIEAKINPLDIDVVHKGLVARVQLVAFKQRSTPNLDGEVTHVSADSFQDKQTDNMYYLAHITIKKDQLKHVKHVKLYPGMPAQVMIITDRRTPLRYFITPIRDSFDRAFREQ